MATGKTVAVAETALQFIFNADNLSEEKISAIAEHVKTLAKNLDTEITRVREFKIDIHWKSRVINVPQAIDKFKDLIHELTTGLRDKVIEIARPFADFGRTVKLESFTEDPLGGPASVSKLATAFGKVEDFITNLNILVGDLDNAVVAASDLTQLFDRVLKDVEHLDDLFLQQKSKRKKATVTYFKRNA